MPIPNYYRHNYVNVFTDSWLGTVCAFVELLFVECTFPTFFLVSMPIPNYYRHNYVNVFTDSWLGTVCAFVELLFVECTFPTFFLVSMPIPNYYCHNYVIVFTDSWLGTVCAFVKLLFVECTFLLSFWSSAGLFVFDWYSQSDCSYIICNIIFLNEIFNVVWCSVVNDSVKVVWKRRCEFGRIFLFMYNF